MRKSVFILVLLSFTIGGYSQDSLSTYTSPEVFSDDSRQLLEPKVTFDVDIRAAFTTGEFKAFYPKRGMGGFGITTLFPIDKHNPVDIGFGLGYYFMSNSEATFDYYTPGAGNYEITSEVSGSMVPIHLTARIYPFKSFNLPIQPYLEGLGGARLFIVTQRLETYLTDAGFDLDPQVETDVTGSWSYGFGGGLKVLLSRNELLYLNAKVTQLYGTSTNNMDPSSVVLYDNGSYSYSMFKSETNVLRFALGIHIMIE